jgi:hypothetical protein
MCRDAHTAWLTCILNDCSSPKKAAYVTQLMHLWWLLLPVPPQQLFPSGGSNYLHNYKGPSFLAALFFLRARRTHTPQLRNCLQGLLKADLTSPIFLLADAFGGFLLPGRRSSCSPLEVFEPSQLTGPKSSCGPLFLPLQRRASLQMWHVGRISHESLQPGGGKPVAPSAIRARSKTYLINADGTGSFAETTEPRALEPAEIAGIVEDYRKARALNRERRPLPVRGARRRDKGGRCRSRRHSHFAGDAGQ